MHAELSQSAQRGDRGRLIGQHHALGDLQRQAAGCKAALGERRFDAFHEGALDQLAR